MILPPVVGADGCAGGWMAVYAGSAGPRWAVYPDLEELLEAHSGAREIWVDVPLGLPESPEDLRPEPEGRRLLGRRACTLFSVPCRQATVCDGYPEASTVNRQILSRGLSRQSWNIVPAIRQADRLLQNPQTGPHLRESHPELCFGWLRGGGKTILPLMEPKHTREGLTLRMDLLKQHLSLNSLQKPPPRWAADLADTLVLFVCAAMSQSAGARTIPECPAVDPNGIPMALHLPANLIQL